MYNILRNSAFEAAASVALTAATMKSVIMLIIVTISINRGHRPVTSFVSTLVPKGCFVLLIAKRK
jgi:hypothetical protein